MKKPILRSGASKAGYHFSQLHDVCPRKFYFRHVLGWETRFTAPALLAGAAFHFAKAVFYWSGQASQAKSALAEALAKFKDQWEYPEDKKLASARLPHMLSAWIEEWGKGDLANYEILEIEQEHEVKLDGGFVFSCRPDAVVRDKSGHVLIMETKTTGYSANVAETEVAYGDQSTAYIYSLKEKYGKKLLGVLPDIVFWFKKSLDASKITCIRGQLVDRSAWELEDWYQGISQLTSEIAQKTKALKTHSLGTLFRRHTSSCISYARPCEYLSICREKLPSGLVPHGFKKEKKT